MMSKFRRVLNDLLIAGSLLTRIPLPQPVWPEDESPARAAWTYPLAGFLIALLTGLVSLGLLNVGMPASFVAGIAIAISVLSTGAMHEDGLADCADGFWGGWDRARRLKIMKDSNTGAYGAIALLLAVGLRWTALTELFLAEWVWLPLLVSAIASRTCMVWVMACLPNAREDGLSNTTGRPSLLNAAIGSVWGILICVLLGWPSFVLICLAAVSTALWSRIALRKIGGQTGDVLGATQQICEITLLGAMTVLVI
ncbi:MAG: adenosylcobinamide-GDP ribazoletransferase [Litoreibacter sp.]